MSEEKKDPKGDPGHLHYVASLTDKVGVAVECKDGSASACFVEHVSKEDAESLDDGRDVYAPDGEGAHRPVERKKSYAGAFGRQHWDAWERTFGGRSPTRGVS